MKKTMKNWKNVSSYEEAKRWIESNIGYRMFDEGNNIVVPENIEFNVAFENAIKLLDVAKNSAVRAAVHKEYIGGSVFLQYRTTDDGVAYYDPVSGEYLGRGTIEYATFIRPNDYFGEFGFVKVSHTTPLD